MSWRFLIERVLWTVIVIVGITLVTFVLTRLIPADPARAAAGPEASAEAVQTLRTLMGLDRPLPVQYGSYMRDLVALNFGRSIQTQRYVREDLAAFFPATAELAIAVMLVYATISIGLGIVAAISQGRALDYAIRILALVGVGLPAFWPSNRTVPLFTSSIGLLIILLYIPGGFTQIGYWLRGSIVNWLEKRLPAAQGKTRIAPPASRWEQACPNTGRSHCREPDASRHPPCAQRPQPPRRRRRAPTRRRSPRRRADRHQ